MHNRTNRTSAERGRLAGRLIIALASIGPVCLGFVAGPAAATTATAAISAGSLTFMSLPSSVSFSATLAGSDQTVDSGQNFDVSDASGSAAGWNITATSTTFTSGASTLSTGATTIQAAPSIACDSGTSCTLATTNVSYPYSLPAGPTAPTATKMFNATAGTGMGNETASATFRLAIPAGTAAGTYTSTWTFSLVSGP